VSRPPKPTGRRAARRAALFLLYQWDLTGRPLASLYDGEIDPFAKELAERVSEEAEALDARIDEAAEDWTADRMGVVERNVLRIGVHELSHGTVPVEVAIGEAVTLATREVAPILSRIADWAEADRRSG